VTGVQTCALPICLLVIGTNRGSDNLAGAIKIVDSQPKHLG
jgi:hypothetical protein